MGTHTKMTIPGTLLIEGDGRDPRKTKIKDAATGKDTNLPINSLQFTVTVDEPPSVVLVLGGISIRSEVHNAAYEIEEHDLRELAHQNGFEIVPAPAFPALVEPYGVEEVRISFRDVPGAVLTVQKGTRPHEIIRLASEKLFHELQKMPKPAWPQASEPLDTETIIHAFRPQD